MIEKRRSAGALAGTAKALKSHDPDLAPAKNLPQQNPTDASETKTKKQGSGTPTPKVRKPRKVKVPKVAPTPIDPTWTPSDGDRAAARMEGLTDAEITR